MQNNNTQQGFSMEEYNKFLKMIKAGSPVHKINFNIESPNAIVGMYLMTMQDSKSYIDESADYTDLNNDTLLVFESRHVVECCQIICGCLNVLAGIGLYTMAYEYFINRVLDTLLTRPLFYEKAMEELSFIVNDIFNISNYNNSDKEKIYEKFKYILQNIWFIPYGKIDEIAEEAIKEFKEQCKDGDNNE